LPDQTYHTVLAFKACARASARARERASRGLERSAAV